MMPEVRSKQQAITVVVSSCLALLWPVTASGTCPFCCPQLCWDLRDPDGEEYRFKAELVDSLGYPYDYTVRWVGVTPNPPGSEEWEAWQWAAELRIDYRVSDFDQKRDWWEEMGAGSCPGVECVPRCSHENPPSPDPETCWYDIAGEVDIAWDHEGTPQKHQHWEFVDGVRPDLTVPDIYKLKALFVDEAHEVCCLPYGDGTCHPKCPGTQLTSVDDGDVEKIFRLYAVKVNLDVDSVEEDAEEYPGYYIGVNDGRAEANAGDALDNEDSDPLDASGQVVVTSVMAVLPHSIDPLPPEFSDPATRVTLQHLAAGQAPLNTVRVFAVKDNQWDLILNTQQQESADIKDYFAAPPGGRSDWAFYVEGVTTGACYLRLWIETPVQPPHDGVHTLTSWYDTVLLWVVRADADVDSDNTAASPPYAPDGTDEEDRIEDKEGEPGRLVAVNNDDDDNDGIADSNDGYDNDPNETDDDVNAAEDDFVALRVTISDSVDPAVAHLRIDYYALPPGLVGPPSPEQRLRIWRKPGDQLRDPQSALDAAQGHFVAPGIYEDLSRLNAGSLAQREIMLYIEGVQTSAALGDCRITVDLDPDGPGPAGWVHSDAVRVTVISVHLRLMWETNNKANQIFNPTWKDDKSEHINEVDLATNAIYGTCRNFLYLVADEDFNEYRASLDLDVQPVSIRQRFFCAAYGDGGVKVLGSDTQAPLDPGAPVEMVFTDPTTAAKTTDFAIKAGYDANADEALDPNEARELFVYRKPDTGDAKYALVKGTNNAKFTEQRDLIQDRLTAYGHDPEPADGLAINARSLLSIFVHGSDGQVRQDMKPNTTTGVDLDAFMQASATDSCFSEWLSHNAGEQFNDSGFKQIRLRTWNWDSRLAQFLARRSPFAPETSFAGGEQQTPTGVKLKQFYDTYVKAAAEVRLAPDSVPDWTTVTMPTNGEGYSFPYEGFDLFPTESPSWVPKATVTVGDAGSCYGGWGALLDQYLNGTDSFDEFDAAGAIGRARLINPKCWFIVIKRPGNVYAVESVRFACAINDLYDFSYEDVDVGSAAAAVQLGYGNGNNGRNEGIIYRDTIVIDCSYTYPFEQTPPP